jgi:hypothetical protein
VIAVPYTTQTHTSYYIASAGTGSLSVIKETESKTVSVAEYDMSTDEAQPFLIRAVGAVQDDRAEVVLSRAIRIPQDEPSGSKRAAPKHNISYELVCVVILLSEDSDKTASRELSVLWRLSGEEFPTYVERVGGRWIFGASKTFVMYGSTKDDSTGGDIGRDALTADQSGAAMPVDETDYPYSWSQTKTSINLTIEKLPADILPSRDIVCLLRPNTLTLQIHARENASLKPLLRRFLRNGGKDGVHDWWDTIQGQESTWTWEKEFDPATGTTLGKLELSLEKANEGVKWPQLFAPRQENDEDDQGLLPVRKARSAGGDEDEWTYKEIEVPETMSEEDRAYVKASLEGFHQTPTAPPKNKYAGLGHQDLASFAQSKPVAAGHGEAADRASAILPGLLREEIEEEDDDGFDDDDHMDGGEFASLGGAGSSKAGKESVFTYLEDDADRTGYTVKTFSKTPSVSVLSRPMKGRLDQPDQSLLVKAHVDGNLYAPPRDLSEASWKHVATNPAISFVLASKRDAQFVYHQTRDNGAVVFIFESRQAHGLGGNMYVYWPPVKDTSLPPPGGKSRATEAQQTVIKFGEGFETGQLLGVKTVSLDNGTQAVVGLAEKAIIVLSL